MSADISLDQSGSRLTSFLFSSLSSLASCLSSLLSCSFPPLSKGIRLTSNNTSKPQRLYMQICTHSKVHERRVRDPKRVSTRKFCRQQLEIHTSRIYIYRNYFRLMYTIHHHQSCSPKCQLFALLTVYLQIPIMQIVLRKLV